MHSTSAPIPALPALQRWASYACLALGMSLVGSYVALSKPLVTVLPVFLLAWLRFGIAALAMGHWLRPDPQEPAMTRQTRRLVFLESFFGNFLFSICMLYGVSMTSAVSAGVIMASIPAAVALMSWGLLKEHIAPRVWLAVLCSALGIALLSLSKTPPQEAQLPPGQALWGNLLVFGAVLCEAAYVVIGKRLTGALSAKRISSLINLWGFALMTPLGLYFAWGFNFAAVAYSVWVLLFFYAMAASVWTVWLWMTGLKRVPAAHAGVFTVMLPIAAAVTGVFALGERFTGMHLLAFASALVGVVLATWPQRTPSEATQAPMQV